MKKPVIFYFLVGIAAVALFLLAFSLLIPHRTGVVTAVGRVSSYTVHTGTGRHSAGHTRYASEVKVQVKGTGERQTVHYRVDTPAQIPAVGDEIEFADYPLTGNGPYPEIWAVELGAIMLALDGAVAAGYLIWKRRKNEAYQRQEEGEGI